MSASGEKREAIGRKGSLKDLRRERIEGYVASLEKALFDAHCMFWYGIGPDGLAVPVAHVEDDIRMREIVLQGLEAIGSVRGADAAALPVRRMDRRILRLFLLALFVIIVAWETASYFTEGA